MVSLASTIASLFMNKFINYIGEGLENGLDSVSSKITVAVISMLCIYALGWLASFAYTRIMAVVTQSFLHSMRKKMFDKMQSFPLRYFDSNAHGDIMSHYTNDIDAIRELVSSTLPHLMQSALIVGFLVFNMFYLSAWMALVVGFASIAMIVVAKKIGGDHRTCHTPLVKARCHKYVWSGLGVLTDIGNIVKRHTVLSCPFGDYPCALVVLVGKFFKLLPATTLLSRAMSAATEQQKIPIASE
jgi:ABC-type multidrug transport system fused ATPase/permease subunit